MRKTLILNEFKKQKEALPIPYEAIASRSGFSIAVALDYEASIKYKHSAKSPYKMQVEEKVLEIVERVLHTDQPLNTKTGRKMLSQAKAMIAKMPKSQVWG